jgi:hypothetical protein
MRGAGAIESTVGNELKREAKASQGQNDSHGCLDNPREHVYKIKTDKPLSIANQRTA